MTILQLPWRRNTPPAQRAVVTVQTVDDQQQAAWRLADCIPMPAAEAGRDPAADIEEFADYLRYDLAPFLRATIGRFPGPRWCPAGCHTNLRLLTLAEQEEHWQQHPYLVKRRAQRRARR
jgi:hypothetical protein